MRDHRDYKGTKPPAIEADVPPMSRKLAGLEKPERSSGDQVTAKSQFRRRGFIGFGRRVVRR